MRAPAVLPRRRTSLPRSAAGLRRRRRGWKRGSSFVGPMMKKWAGEYLKARGVEIDYSARLWRRHPQMLTRKTSSLHRRPDERRTTRAAPRRAAGVAVRFMGASSRFTTCPRSNHRSASPVRAGRHFSSARSRMERRAAGRTQPGVALPDWNHVAHRSDASAPATLDRLPVGSDPSGRKKFGAPPSQMATGPARRERGLAAWSPARRGPGLRRVALRPG